MFTDYLRSPEDHAILEAEYLRNPKPDKAARIEIVNRVALGEKEVQVSAIKSGKTLPMLLQRVSGWHLAQTMT